MTEPNRADDGLPMPKKAAWVAGYRPSLRVTEQGSLVSIGDGIAWIRGLPSAAVDEVLNFEDGSQGICCGLERDLVGAVLLRQTQGLTAGTSAFLTGRQASIPAGDALMGRVLDPLGAPLDGLPAPDCAARRPLDTPSPPMIQRDFVNEPLFTGIKIVDTLIPIGRGQRQLILGDKGLGRSAIAIDAVLAQRGSGVRCVYVLIGQKRSSVVTTLKLLADRGAMDYTTLVVGEASALPGLKYLAPFAGCAIAEHWMAEGRDTLVIYDDLSTHAQAYRELSLLLRRPPGREAYPGDIFFLHAKLLERATCLAASEGGGSMTALAIVETRLGEIASYIPTNLISITDGQIYLDQALFAGGFLPAIDIARSVSRIGGTGPAGRHQAGSGTDEARLSPVSGPGGLHPFRRPPRGRDGGPAQAGCHPARALAAGPAGPPAHPLPARLAHCLQRGPVRGDRPQGTAGTDGPAARGSGCLDARLGGHAGHLDRGASRLVAPARDGGRGCPGGMTSTRACAPWKTSARSCAP